jgi:RNA polymerase sigma-70 factor (ECF subfamily)
VTTSSAAPARIVVTEALIRAHQAGVWRHLRLCGAPADLADDLTQETFLRLCAQPPEARGDAALAGWLRATARNLLANSRRRPPVLPLDDDAAEAAHAEYDRDDGGERWRRALAACLETLPARERDAIARRYSPGGSRAAIAAALQLADEGVKTLLRRARARLFACVQRRLQEEP